MRLIHFLISGLGLGFLASCATGSVSSVDQGNVPSQEIPTQVQSSQEITEQSSSSEEVASSSSLEVPEEEVSFRLEMPRHDEKFLLVPHWVDCDDLHTLNYTLEWDPAIRHANWVAFRWDAYTSRKEVDRTNVWAWDPKIPENMGAVSEDEHKKDGYDKGHLLASADRLFCYDANVQTFFYSNISPQLNVFNAGYWERLEELVRNWGHGTLRGELDTLYVVKGGSVNDLLKNYTAAKTAQDGVVPSADSLGRTAKGLIVPAYFYMALLAVKDGAYKAIGFYVPHKEDLPRRPPMKKLQQYTVSIDSLESLTNLDFFHNLPDEVENAVEADLDLEQWTW